MFLVGSGHGQPYVFQGTTGETAKALRLCEWTEARFISPDPQNKKVLLKLLKNVDAGSDRKVSEHIEDHSLLCLMLHSYGVHLDPAGKQWG